MIPTFTSDSCEDHYEERETGKTKHRETHATREPTTYRHLRVLPPQRSLPDPGRLLERLKGLAVVLRAEVHDPDVVKGRRYVGMELAVPAPLALQNGLEQGERIEGVTVLREKNEERVVGHGEVKQESRRTPRCERSTYA